MVEGLGQAPGLSPVFVVVVVAAVAAVVAATE